MKNQYTALLEEILIPAKSDDNSTLLRRQSFYIPYAKPEKSLYDEDLR